DSRAMVFDANGNILQANDGGIYRLVNPDNASTRIWVSVIGNLRVTEFHAIAYDPVSNIVFGGTQDNGTAVQTAPGSQTWTWTVGGDGGDVAVDGDQVAHAGTSVRYTSAIFLRHFSRQTVDSSDVAGPPVSIGLNILSGDGSGQTLPQFDANIQVYTPFVLN